LLQPNGGSDVTDLHRSIQAYFDADKRNESSAPLRAFAPDAVVKDERVSHVGHEAIDAWWREVKAKYQAIAEPLTWAETNDGLDVRASVVGTFPGSPLVLTFAFRLEDDLIAALTISA
jgi:hypothetical protein